MICAIAPPCSPVGSPSSARNPTRRRSTSARFLDTDAACSENRAIVRPYGPYRRTQDGDLKLTTDPTTTRAPASAATPTRPDDRAVPPRPQAPAPQSGPQSAIRNPQSAMPTNYRDTLNLPHDILPMRANLPQREPEFQRAWED